MAFWFVFLAAAPADPLVVHTVVLLADNQHQSIVPVRPPLGDGGNPKTNLYWGALYGFDTHFARSRWERVDVPESPSESILAVSAFTKQVDDRRVVVIGEAWNGRHYQAAVERFLLLASGDAPEEKLRVGKKTIDAGGAADVVAFVGHNALLDFKLPSIAHLPKSDTGIVVLACQSQKSFAPIAQTLGLKPILFTRTNMAPEAYTLRAVLEALGRGATGKAVHRAASSAYAKYQRISVSAAASVFSVPESTDYR